MIAKIKRAKIRNRANVNLSPDERAAMRKLGITFKTADNSFAIKNMTYFISMTRAIRKKRSEVLARLKKGEKVNPAQLVALNQELRALTERYAPKK